MLFPRRTDDRFPVPGNLNHRPVWRRWRRRCVCGLPWPCIDRDTGTGRIPHQPPTPPAPSGGTTTTPHWAGPTGPWFGNAGLFTRGQAARISGWTR